MYKITDVSGRLLEWRKDIVVGETIKLGETLRPGIYFATVLQGNNRKVLKIVKR